MRVNGILSLFFRSICWAMMARLKNRGRITMHVCRRLNRTFPVILRKNQSPHCKDDEVQESENKEWNS